MNIYTALKEAYSYAKPTIWKIVWFHTLALMVFGSIAAIGGLGLIMAKSIDSSILFAISILILIAIAIYTYLFLLSSPIYTLQFIIETRNNLKPKVSNLLKSSFKLNWVVIRTNIILGLITLITTFLFNKNDAIHISEAYKHMTTFDLFSQEASSLINYLICPLMSISVIKIYLTKSKAIKSIKYCFSLAMRKHPQILLMPILLYVITSLMPALMIFSGIEILGFIGSLISFISIVMILILDPLINSYFLIQVYNDVIENPEEVVK